MGARKISHRILYVLFVSIFFLPARGECATKGRVTEAIFILQNRQRELSDAIQSLKKRLTDCFAQQKKLLETEACSAKKADHKTLELSHCALYQKLFPIYIKELELLAGQATERIAAFSQDEPVEDGELKKAVDRAFLIKEKIELEFSLIELLVAYDTTEWEVKNKQNGTSQKIGLNLERQNLLRARRNSAFNKKKLKARKAKLAKLNERLYKEKGSAPEKTFLDELTCYAS